MDLALNNLKKVDMPLNKWNQTKPGQAMEDTATCYLTELEWNISLTIIFTSLN